MLCMSCFQLVLLIVQNVFRVDVSDCDRTLSCNDTGRPRPARLRCICSALCIVRYFFCTQTNKLTLRAVTLNRIQTELEDPFDTFGVDDINVALLDEVNAHCFEADWSRVFKRKEMQKEEYEQHDKVREEQTLLHERLSRSQPRDSGLEDTVQSGQLTPSHEDTLLRKRVVAGESSEEKPKHRAKAKKRKAKKN